MKNQLKVISASSFALIFLLFFLPFVSIECGGQQIVSVSGTELVTGFSMDLPAMDNPEFQQQSPDGSNPNVFAIIAFASAILGAILCFVLEGKRNIILIFSGLIIISLIALQIDLKSQIGDENTSMIVNISYNFAYWLSLIIPIILIVFVFLKNDDKIMKIEELQTPGVS